MYIKRSIIHLICTKSNDPIKYINNVFTHLTNVTKVSSINECILIGPCAMDLTAFPMDTVFCWLTFESFNYNADEVKMRWRQPLAIALFDDIKTQWDSGSSDIVATTRPADFINLADYRLINMQTFRNETVFLI